jgi:hypothetical protein
MSRHRPPPLITEILSDEAWFGENLPIWEGAPSSQEAFEKRLAFAKRLRRFANDLPGATALATLLDTCGRNHRCMSGACPECTRAFQRWFVDSSQQLCSVSDPYNELVSASIVFPNGRVSSEVMGELDPINSKRAVTRAEQHFSHWTVGALDISLNDDRQKGLGVAWQLQMYAISMVADRESLSLGLRGDFLGSKEVTRPVLTKKCDGSPKAISYALKTDFVQRIAYRGNAHGNGNARSSWKTRKVSLRPVDHARLLVWLDSVGLAARLYLRGVRMTMTRNGVVLANPKKRGE